MDEHGDSGFSTSVEVGALRSSSMLPNFLATALRWRFGYLSGMLLESYVSRKLFSCLPNGKVPSIILDMVMISCTLVIARDIEN